MRAEAAATAAAADPEGSSAKRQKTIGAADLGAAAYAPAPRAAGSNQVDAVVQLGHHPQHEADPGPSIPQQQRQQPPLTPAKPQFWQTAEHLAAASAPPPRTQQQPALATPVTPEQPAPLSSPSGPDHRRPQRATTQAARARIHKCMGLDHGSPRFDSDDDEEGDGEEGAADGEEDSSAAAAQQQDLPARRVRKPSINHRQSNANKPKVCVVLAARAHAPLQRCHCASLCPARQA